MPHFAFFPGCSLDGTSKEYGASTRAVCEALGIDLQELADWNCCGATSAHCADKLTSEALAARNVALAADTGLDLVVPCAACYNRTRRAAQTMQSKTHRAELARVMGRALPEPGEVLHLLEVFARPQVAASLSEKITRPLAGIKAACYYGCLLVRPPKATGFDDPENPRSMDDLLATCGAEPVSWYFKTECCGASLAIPQAGAVEVLVGRIAQNARSHGADWIITACPLCQVNLETRQRREPGQAAIPVLYFTQALGLAMGLPPDRLGVRADVASRIGREPAAALTGGE